MNTNSDRHEVQTFFETKLNCVSAIQFAEKRAEFEAITLGYQDVEDLRAALAIDAAAYFEKATASLLLGLNSLDYHNETWAFIKLYYSFFFFQKRILCRDSIALVNCKGTAYSVPVQVGATPQRHSGRQYSSDHRAAATVFIQRFKQSNLLLSQLIDGEETPRWLFARRNWLNYQRRNFIDGAGDWALTSSSVSFPDQIALYCADDRPIYCFLPEYASLALPLKIAMQAIAEEGGPATIRNFVDERRAAATDCVRALEEAF